MRAAGLIVLAVARVAAASPGLDHVIDVPTAWLPGESTATATSSLDHHGRGFVSGTAGLGALAEVELGVASDPDVARAHATFRIGAAEDAWFVGMPAFVFGVRTTIGETARVAEAHVVASRRLGPVALHAGVMASDAGNGTRVRPLAAFELTPPQYRKTTLLVELAWRTRFDANGPALSYALGWGVRYQALRWGSIELDVRQREGDLGSPTVMVRLNAVLGYAASSR